MEFKKSIIILIMAVFLASIAGVCASDANDTAIASEDIDDVISVEEDTKLASFEENEILTADEQTFAQLNQTINGNTNNTIYLKSNYKYSSGDDSFKKGVVIDRDVTIYGNGHTIDGNKTARIFQVNGGNVVFYNINFINGKVADGNGGAIDGECKAINCTFNENQAKGGGGAMAFGSAVNCTFTENEASFGGAMYGGSAVNCTFTENTAGAGGAISDGSAVNCTFTENKATLGGAMYGGSAVNCTFTENTAGAGGVMYYGYRWNCIGQNPDDYYSTKDLELYWVVNDFTTIYGSGETLPIKLRNQNWDFIAFINYDVVIYNKTGVVKTYHCLSNDDLSLDLLSGIYTAELTVTYPGLDKPLPKNITLTITDGTFWDLNKTINGNTNDTITLDKNYTFNPDIDSAFTEGIVINRPVTINGNGYTINATGKARIFQVTSNDVTLNNITFTEGNTTGDGGAIYWSSSNANILNCCFVNNTANGYGGANYFLEAVTNVNLTGNFTNNRAENNGGANYFNMEVTNVILTGDFNNNRAENNGGANYFNQAVTNVTLTGDFNNNHAEYYGGANYFYNAVTNVTLTGNFTNNSAQDGGANCFVDAVTNVILTGDFNNNRAEDYDGGANSFWSAVTNVTLTGDFNNNTAENNGGANYFYGVVSNVALTGIFTNNRAETESGGANYFNMGVSNVTLTGNFTNNSAQDGGANYFNGAVTDVTLTGDFNNNTANKYDGGANSFWSAVTNVTLTGDFNNNRANREGGANCFWLAVTNVTLTGNYINNTGKNVIYIGNSVSGNVIRDSIFINNAPITVTKGNISVIDNWFGNNVTDYDVKPDVGIDLDNWLFLNATADYNVIPVFNSSSIVFKLYLYNSTAEEKKVSEYDNALLMPVNLTITSANGDVDSSVANFGESIRYTATHAGEGSVTATLGTAEFTIKLNNLKISPNLSAENQVITYGENATIALNYNSNATGKVNITLTGKKATFTYQNLDLNATIVLSNDVPADEYDVTVAYSGDDNFFNATANATLKVNKANSTLTINGNITFDYNTNGSATVSFTNASGVNAIVVGQPNAIVVVNDTTITVSGLDAGNYTLSVTTITDANHNNVTKTTDIIVNKAKTVLAADAITATYNINKDLVITLKDANGNSVSGVNVTVDLNGAKTYATDSNGQVKVSTAALTPKTYTAKITFAGNTNYIGSSSEVNVIIKKATPIIKAKKKTYKAKKKTKKFTITLKDNAGKPIKNAKVRLMVKKVSKQSKKKSEKKSKSDKKKNYAKTNNRGKATFKVLKNKPGKYNAKVKFYGDQYYTKATKTVKITIR